MKKLFLFLVLYSCAISAFATTGYWTGSNDGVTWADANNWSTAIYPNMPNCLVIFDGDGNHNTADPTLTAAGTAPICIDLGGATININYIVIRDGANVTFKNGTITTVGNNTNGSGLIIQGMSCLTLGEPTVPFTFNSVGRVLIWQTSKLDVDCMANLNITFPASADPAALLEGILLGGPNPKSTLDNCGNIMVGSGFLNGIKAEGCLNNKPTGKIEIKSGTYPGRKSCGLCVGDFNATGGSLNNEGSILVGIGFRTGTSISPGGTFNNIGECSLLSTTSGADGNGLVINGTSDYGEFTNEGLFITDNNGPICENAGTAPDAEFIICTDAPGQMATYTTTVGGVSTSATMELMDVVLENFGTTALSKTTYCKTIVVPSPTADVTLDVQSIGSCASLTCATSIVEKAAIADLKVIKIVEDFTRALDCGESIDTFCVFLGQPYGGNYSYYDTEAEALSGVGTSLGNPFANIKETKEVWVRYEITGSCVATEKINITITPPTFTLVTKDLEICEGASVDISSGFVSFDIGTSNGTTTAPTYYSTLADAQNSINQLTSTVVNAIGSYYIRYDVDTDFGDACEGCGVIEPIEVTFKTKPTAVVSGGGNACTGGSSNVNIALTGTGPWNITYSNGTSATAVSGITTSPYIISGASAGTYTVTSVTDANACSASGTGSAIVNVDALPTAAVSGGGTACIGATLPNVSIALTGISPWDLTYTDGTTATTVTGITTSPYIISGASTGTYTVTSITDANSCNGAGTSTAIVNVVDCSIAPDYTFTYEDPCNCSNPANITLADGRILFADILTVTPLNYVTPVVTITGDDNFLDAAGEPIPTSILTDNGEGVYALPFYTLQEAPAMITIDVNGATKNFTTSSCTPCTIITSALIPTMSQWGLLIFGLLLLNLNISFLYRKEAL